MPPPLPTAAAEDDAFAELANEAIILEDEPGTPAAPPSGSTVDLGRHGADVPSAPGTPAGEPSLPWEALVEEPASPGKPTPPRFDAPPTSRCCVTPPPRFSPRPSRSARKKRR